MTHVPYADRPDPAPPGRRPGTTMAIVGGGLLALALLVAAVSGFVGYRTVSGAVAEGINEFAAPGSTTHAAEAGESVTIFLEDGTLSPGATRPAATVTGPDGAAVPTGGANGYLELNGRRFDGLASFTAPATGDYAIAADLPEGDSATLAVGPDLTGLIGGVFGGLAGVCLAVVLGLTGLVLLIVGLVRRSRG